MKAPKKILYFTLILFLHSSLFAEEVQGDGVDAFWTEISNSVSNGDFKAYRSAHHEDGVLIMGGKSISLVNAHKGFQRGFDDTASGKVQAGIEFLWSNRSVGEQTAILKGLFYYWSKAEGVDFYLYTPIEVVLVKKDKSWKILTFRRDSPVTKEQWNKLKSSKE